jgi:hypothetical protein
MKRQTALLLAALLAPAAVYAADSEFRDVVKVRQPISVRSDDTVASAVAIGDSIRVNGTVEENAVAIGGNIYVGPMGVIKGDAVALGGRVIRDPGSAVNGKTTAFPWSLSRVGKGLAVVVPAMTAGLGAVVGAAIIFGSVGSIALALVVLLIFPGQIEAARRELAGHPVSALLIGILALLMALPVMVFLVITIIGIPLAFMAAALLMAALILGTVTVGQWIGVRLTAALKRPLYPVFTGFLGLLALTVAAAMPVVGIFIQAFVVCFALGCVALSRFRSV